VTDGRTKLRWLRQAKAAVAFARKKHQSKTLRPFITKVWTTAQQQNNESKRYSTPYTINKH